MTSRSKRSSRQLRQLNPAFAASHGIGDSVKNDVIVEESSLQRAQNAVKRARSTGKLSVANADLSTPLPDILFDLRHGMEVNLSMDASTLASYECHAEETLTLVDFSDNDLGGILDDRIGRYQSLGIFRLKRCSLSGIPIKSLQSLTNLTILDLASNKLTSFCVDMLPTSIRELDLSSNKLECLLMENEASASVVLPYLIKFNISHNNLVCIPSGLKCPRLQSLDCSHNRISAIPSSFLESAVQSLTTLEARHNCIDSVPNLSEFQQLRIVDLSENKLTKIPVVNLLLSRLSLSENQLASFSGLFDDSTDSSQLVELHLQGNNLTELDAYVMQRLLQIKLLDLRNNNLSSLPPVLGYLPSVRQVPLDGNPLRTLGSVDHHNTTDLQALLRKRGPSPPGNGYLRQEVDPKISSRKDSSQASESSQSSTKMSSGCVVNLSSCLVGTNILKLEDKQLATVPQSLMDQLKSSPRLAERIQVLKLGKNKIETLTGGIFAVLPNVTTLEVNQNRLVQLPDELGTLSLNDLSVSQNRLVSEVIASSALGNSLGTAICKTLTELDLSSNRLGWFPAGLMELNALRVLNLSNNRIASLAGWKPGLPALQDLMLSDNRIDDLDDLPLALGATCPMLKTLLLHNNEIGTIPPQLGMLSSLQAIDLRGNPQRAVRSAILEKECSAILLYLKNRMTPTELQEYEAKRHAITNEATASIEVVSSAETSKEEQVKQPSNADDEPISSPLVEELRAEIDALSLQLNNVHLTEAKKYAIKKKLAIQKSKLIREERRLREESH